MGGSRKCINLEFIIGWDHRVRRPSSRAEAAMLAMSLACYNLSTASPKFSIIRKLEKFLKGSLDLIPSPSLSVKIQIMGGKVCFRCKGKTLPSNVLP